MDSKNFHWVLSEFSDREREQFCQVYSPNGDRYRPKRTKLKSLDCSIMELADDIATVFTTLKMP
ncbi:hypothetical protein JCM19241_4480 [Vibrio ishigakensis]|uniref:Uncharacterized protein n=1 Tax=Vibrio ishigakensis TaxID=1481914 RepID=A0A0B8QGU3_9VIBR|nr:hypothetical protein JCM19241_4480 [Vibrio ishigakensis]